MAPFQLFGNVHGAQQATSYSEIYTKICGLEKPVDLDGLSALHWVWFIHFNFISVIQNMKKMTILIDLK